MVAYTLTWYWAALLGISAGLIGSLTGVGGGLVIVPVLALLFALPQKIAQGTSLAVIAPMALMGALRYAWHADVRLDWRLIAVLTVAGIVGANMGASLAMVLPAATLRRCFGVVMAIAGLRMVFSR